MLESPWGLEDVSNWCVIVPCYFWFWHWMQAHGQVLLSYCTCGQTNRSETNFTDALIAGCDNPWRLLKACFLHAFVTKGFFMGPPVSQYICVSLGYRLSRTLSLYPLCARIPEAPRLAPALLPVLCNPRSVGLYIFLIERPPPCSVRLRLCRTSIVNWAINSRCLACWGELQRILLLYICDWFVIRENCEILIF